MEPNIASTVAIDCLITTVSFTASSFGKHRPISIPKAACPMAKSSVAMSSTAPCRKEKPKAIEIHSPAITVQGRVSRS